MIQECDRPKKEKNDKGNPKGTKGGKPKGNDGGKGKPIIKAVTQDDSKSETEPKPARELQREGSDPKEPEGEPMKEMMEQFNKMIVKAIKEKSEEENIDLIVDSLKQRIGAKTKAVKIKKVNPEVRRYGLLDSGSTNNVREIKDDEDLEGVVPIEVEVASEGEV